MSKFGSKVVAVIDTQSAFGVTIKSMKENVDTLVGQMSTLLADAPETLDTLNEIAAAMSDDPAFFTTMATANTTLQDNITALATAAATARTALQTALQSNIDSTALTGSNARGVLSGRLDALELDPVTKTYVDAAVTDLIDAAPGVLDTLNEIAAAIGDDANFVTTVTDNIAAVQADVDANELASDNAEAALSTRLDTLEADPTTATAVAAVQADVDANETASDAAEAALAGRLDVLEADPTTKTYVDNQVAGLVDSAPGVLNTLDELAAALGDDANFATTITNSIAAVQTNVDANETALDAAEAALSTRLDTLEVDPTTATAVAAVQTDVDANEAERKTYFDWDSNLAKVINPVRGSRIDVGNNITFYPAAGYNTEIKGNLTTDNTTKVFFTLTDAADDAAAATAGVAVGQLYRNGSVVMIRVS